MLAQLFDNFTVYSDIVVTLRPCALDKFVCGMCFWRGPAAVSPGTFLLLFSSLGTRYRHLRFGLNCPVESPNRPCEC